MALTTEQKASFLFKQAQGVAETSVTRDFFEEPRKGPTLVLNDQIWAQSGSIPTTAPTLADGETLGVVQRFIDRTMTAVAGVSNSFYLADLIDAIPFNFGDGSYNYALKDSSGNAISFGQGDWLVENTGGVLTFYGLTPGNMPPKISFYKYVGTKGISGGGSGVTSVNGDSGPAVILSTSNIPEGSNLYFTDGRAQTAVVTSDTSGSQTNLAPSIAALKTYVASQLAASSVTSVNGLTGAVVLTTTDIGEGSNLYFTDARAEAAAVVDSTSGSQTTKAPSVAAMKAYVASQSAPVTSVNSQTGDVYLVTSDVPEVTGGAANWSATASLSTPRQDLAGVGTQNQALAIGGYTNAFLVTSSTESFNGSAWSSSTNLLSERSALAAAGLYNAASAFGGYNNGFVVSNSTQKFNGSSWSLSGNLTTARFSLGGVGSQDAALAFGGNLNSSSSIFTTITDSFNGSSWTAKTGLATARANLAGAGSQNAALAFGGESGLTIYALTEKFDGSTWSSTGSLPSAKYALGGAGSQNAAIAFGGIGSGTGRSNITQTFNGSIWSSTTNMLTAKSQLAAAGNQSAALSFAGNTGSQTATAEKYAGATTSVLYFTDARAISAISSGTLTGPLSLGPTGTISGNGGQARFYELAVNGSNYVGFKAPDSITANLTWTLPASDGTANQVLKTDGAGNLGWVSQGGSLDPTQPVTTGGYILSSSGITTQTGSYTLQASDNGKIILANSASALTLTVPTGLNVGFSCMIIQIGVGQVTIAASGVTLNATNGLKIGGQYGIANVVSYQSNVYAVSGYTTN